MVLGTCSVPRLKVGKVQKHKNRFRASSGSQAVFFVILWLKRFEYYSAELEQQAADKGMVVLAGVQVSDLPGWGGGI